MSLVKSFIYLGMFLGELEEIIFYCLEFLDQAVFL